RLAALNHGRLDRGQALRRPSGPEHAAPVTPPRGPAADPDRREARPGYAPARRGRPRRGPDPRPGGARAAAPAGADRERAAWSRPPALLAHVPLRPDDRRRPLPGGVDASRRAAATGAEPLGPRGR